MLQKFGSFLPGPGSAFHFWEEVFVRSRQDPGRTQVQLLLPSRVFSCQHQKNNKMIYQVKAKFNYDKAQEFYRKLKDGTIEKQRPDGPEIVSSMNRATIDNNGDINWTELCFCPTPLQHERATVYDMYFNDIKTEVVLNQKIIEGSSFMEKLSSF